MDIYHHIYNRGAHKAAIFNDGSDYERMQKLLYIANSDEPFVMANIKNKNIFSIHREKMLVDIVAYCLMPNHVHIALSSRGESRGEASTNNISRFMHKLMTGYSGYFNKKYDHSGTIWQGPYKEKTVHDQIYLDVLINYIHLNPYGIEEPNMTKEARREHLADAIEYSKNYAYSSFRDYAGEMRDQTSILSRNKPHRGLASM